ncbi:MAG: tRNA (N6-isopentenyl adenosine(37)-C2)-methylthiotransferase MiaB [Bacillota bacterium]
MRYHILTYGCQMNVHDSETLAGILENTGYEPTGRPEEADFILLNTCAVRQTAEERILGRLGELKRFKYERPGIIIGVCGCVPQQKGAAERIMQRAPHVDLIFGTHNLHRLPELLARAGKGQRVIEVVEGAGRAEGLPMRRQGGHAAWVNITYGCDNFCSYCIVPYVRGRERSRPPEAVLEEVQQLAREGYLEITLLGQNVNSYGRDLRGSVTFAGLLRQLDAIPGLERLRYMTSHPRDFTDELIEVIAGSSKVCEHFHLPLQAGSDRILRAMNRGYTQEHYLGLIEKIRRAVPGASLTTDIIVGFPGETEEDFLETMRVVDQLRYDAAFTFMYSPRGGTPAAARPDQIAAEVKKERLARLMRRQNEISREINKHLVGTRAEVLVEGESATDPAMYTGRTRTNKPVLFPACPDLSGSLQSIRITEARTFTLYGVVHD